MDQRRASPVSETNTTLTPATTASPLAVSDQAAPDLTDQEFFELLENWTLPLGPSQPMEQGPPETANMEQESLEAPET